jgi:hypothetical protein
LSLFFIHDFIFTTETQSPQRGRAATKNINHRGHRDHGEISKKINKNRKMQKTRYQMLAEISRLCNRVIQRNNSGTKAKDLGKAFKTESFFFAFYIFLIFSPCSLGLCGENVFTERWRE